MISSNPIEYKQYANRSIWPVDGIQIGTILMVGEPGSNGNEEVLTP